MTEKELEKLFKTKLASGTYQFNPEAWKSMENILDQTATRGGVYYWRSAAAILIFAVLVGSLGVTWKPQSVEVYALPAVEVRPEITMDPIVSTAVTSESSELKAIEVEPPTPANPEEVTLASSSSSALITQNDPSPPVTASATTTLAMAGAPESHNKMESFPLALEPTYSESLELPVKSTYLPSNKQTLEVFTPPALEANKYRTFRQHLYLKGGTVLNESYNTGNMGVGFHLGAEYQIGLGKNFDLSAGLNYSRINKVGIHQQYDSTFYHFSSERIETEINGHQLNYLELPLSINWRFHPRHQLGLGVYGAMLLSVSESTEKRYYNQNDMTAESSSTVEGKLSPYESFDAGIGFSYFFMVDRQLELGVEFRKGWTDITKDTENVYVQEHNNINTRLSLRYRIL